MNTRITDIHRTQVRELEAVAPATPVRATDAVAGHPAGTPSAGVDRVSLSREARELAAQPRDEAATQKIAQLREALQSGRLAVDAHAIAARMLGD